ncbi:MAG: sugar ABC transporter ATP-binding protein [Clostridiales bacterium]|nr:sugar ABC transporter ATP-binding protein [Clostridiales bacterium]
MEKTILEMEHITKYIYDAYGKPIRGTNVKILSDVHLDVREREVHILIGENGAGKSTLMKILGGIIPHDEGTVRLFGQEVRFTNPRQSQAMGVGFIHQELDLCLNLDVAENLFLGQEIGRLFSDKREMYRQSRLMLEKLGFDIDPRTPVRRLSTAHQQMVEIVKAVSRESKIIIMDEPTASLTQAEIDHLFEIIRNLKRQGVSIVYISHRFEELKEIGDRLTVLRDGGYVGTIDMADFEHGKVVGMMVGRELSCMYHCSHRPEAGEVLRVEGLKIGPDTVPIDLTVHRGEVVGIGGLVGAGRTELAKSIFGVRRYFGGRIFYHGRAVAGRTPQQWIDDGLMYLTEDRKIEGLVLPMSIEGNITLASLRRLFPYTRLKPRVETAIAREMIDKLRIVCRGPKQAVNTLSGGNQQEVVLGKWLSAKPRLLILDEPTRGVDVGAKAEIYEIIDGLAREGVAILMISSELSELINMSDRIYVMRRGTVSAEMRDPAAFTQESILAHTL